MGCWVLRDIVIPLVSALIGGGLTLFGVWATIKHGDKIRIDDHEREMKIQAKPILINFPPEQDPIAHATTFSFSAPGDSVKAHSIRAIVKNTDNGIAFLDNITTHNVIYYPGNNSTVDKGTVAFLEFFPADKKEGMQDIKLHLHDLYGNPYCYDLNYIQTIRTGSKPVNLSLGLMHEVGDKNNGDK